MVRTLIDSFHSLVADCSSARRVPCLSKADLTVRYEVPDHVLEKGIQGVILMKESRDWMGSGGVGSSVGSLGWFWVGSPTFCWTTTSITGMIASKADFLETYEAVMSILWNDLMLVLRPWYAVFDITTMYILCTTLSNIYLTISICVGNVHKVMQFISLPHQTSQHMFDDNYLYIGSLYGE